MTTQSVVKHKIEKYILSILSQQEFARFRDMRPPKIDTNLYSYHLKLLQKNGLVVKTDDGYMLTLHGMSFIDEISDTDQTTDSQPKVSLLFVVQNGYGGILMHQNTTQPFINRWTLPSGKVRRNNVSLQQTAEHELSEKLGQGEVELSHVGDCYVRVSHSNTIQISELVHVFYGTTDQELETGHLKWISPHELTRLNAAPAIEQIVARTFFRDPYFFEEYTVDW